MLTIEQTGFREIAIGFRAAAAELRGADMAGVEVVPAGGDQVKADALVARGRDVFETDQGLVDEVRDLFMTAVGEMLDRLESGGRVGHLVTAWARVGEHCLETVRGRLDDTLPTPSGKAPLSERYAAWKARQAGAGNTIGKLWGGLYQGLVWRPVR